jgi:hypothetical protein
MYPITSIALCADRAGVKIAATLHIPRITDTPFLQIWFKNAIWLGKFCYLHNDVRSNWPRSLKQEWICPLSSLHQLPHKHSYLIKKDCGQVIWLIIHIPHYYTNTKTTHRYAHFTIFKCVSCHIYTQLTCRAELKCVNLYIQGNDEPRQQKIVALSGKTM